jgi:two-component system response regulator YcbB
MKFYILDDNINIIKILEQIVEDIGEVVGFNTSSKAAFDEILELQPDIVLVDLLMPEIDGIKLVKMIKEDLEDIDFIMISQVSNKKLVGESYESGIDFFISKPINKFEVLRVIENVIDLKEYKNKFNKINKIMNNSELFDEQTSQKKANYKEAIEYILNDIGIFGEKGAHDLVEICLKLINDDQYDEDSLNQAYKALFSNVNATKQRIRRAVSKGLTNIASLGIEDFMNVKFEKYSNNLYDFENVKLEMDYIRNKRDKGGKINVKKFIDNLIIMVKRD